MSPEPDLRPALINQSWYARAKYAFAEPSPADRRSTHWTRLSSRVQSEVAEGIRGLTSGERPRTIRICEHSGAVVDGCYLAMKSWITGRADVVRANAN